MFARGVGGDEALASAAPARPPASEPPIDSQHRAEPIDSQLRALLDIAPFSVIMVDVCAAGQPVVYANDRFVEQTGYSRAAVLYNNSGLEVLHGPETDDEIVGDMHRCVARGDGWSGKLLSYLADGTKMSSHVLVHPVVNVHSGRVTHYTAIHLFTGPADAPEEVTRRAVQALGARGARGARGAGLPRHPLQVRAPTRVRGGAGAATAAAGAAL